MSQTNLVTKAHQHVDSTAINKLLSAPGFEKLKWISLDAYAHNGDGQAQIHYAAIADAKSGDSITKANLAQKIKILSIAYTDENIVQPGFQLTMHGNFSSELFKINTHYYKQAILLPPKKPTIICTEFTLPNLANGTYTFSLALTSVVDGRIEFIFNVNDGLNLTVDIAHPAFNMGTQLVVPDAKVYNMETENIKTDNSKSI
jgi:hypothetical protein